MLLAESIYARLGIEGLSFQINSTGCPQCKPGYIGQLVAYLEARYERLTPLDRDRLANNPLRVLDSKEPGMDELLNDAPHIADHLCDECRHHFAELRTHLDHLQRSYTINFRLVRGLDYYTKTVFEVWAEGIGAQSAVCGGGRYDGLAETMDGPPTPGVGFGAGLERIVLAMQVQGIAPPPILRPLVFVVPLGRAARFVAFDVAHNLRQAGVGAEIAFSEADDLGRYGQRSLKSQLREANRRGARYAVILGQAEIEAGQTTVRDMAAGEQERVPLAGLTAWLEARTRRS